MTREEQKQISIENQNKRLEETILLCTEFLLTNSSDIELSKKTGISSSTVGRRLTNQKYVYMAYEMVKENLKKVGLEFEQLPTDAKNLFELIQNKRYENYLKGKALGGQTTFLNHIYLMEDNKFNGVMNLSLKAFYSDISNQYKFLAHAALCFRLHLDTLNMLFQISEQELIENINKYCVEQLDALNVLFSHDNNDQTIARKAFIHYYHELNEAIRHKDLSEKRRLIIQISDFKAVKLLERIRKAKSDNAKYILTDIDIETLLKYQIKYSLTSRNIEYNFDINGHNYQKRVHKFLLENPELKDKYENLIAYNEYKHKSIGGYRGR